MKVKICGLTRPEDAQLAYDLGAWALGFIFYPPSKRYISVDMAEALLTTLPENALTVGVFVNQVDEAIMAAESLSLKALQLHGDETPEDCARVKAVFDGIVIKALRPKNTADLQQITAYKDTVDYILIDAAVAGQYGGSGQVADWSLAIEAQKFDVPVILAGGITPDNVCAAVNEVRPFAIDLAGGVEASHGTKDPQKMNELFKRLKEDT